MQTVRVKHISKDVDVIYTDERPICIFAAKDNFDGKHKTIDHTRSYAIGRTHTNATENAFRRFKRGLLGSYQQVSIKHVSRYCHEFSDRFIGGECS
jgi:hypothetical protein